jgi:hypothetical protein
MATANQRAVAICDAIVNGTSTADQRQRVLSAFGSADVFLKEVRRWVLGNLILHEADALIRAAQQGVENDIASDFTEAP